MSHLLGNAPKLIRNDLPYMHGFCYILSQHLHATCMTYKLAIGLDPNHLQLVLCPPRHYGVSSIITASSLSLRLFKNAHAAIFQRSTAPRLCSAENEVATRTLHGSFFCLLAGSHCKAKNLHALRRFDVESPPIIVFKAEGCVLWHTAPASRLKSIKFSSHLIIYD